MHFPNPFRRRNNDDTQTLNVDSDGNVAVTKPPHFLISGDLNITLVFNGRQHLIANDHPNHGAILDAIREKRWDDLESLVDIPQVIENYMEGNIAVNEYGEVSYRGEVIHNTITDRIRLFIQQGLDHQPLVRFLDNLMDNPSRRAVEELYPFLENRGMAITEDGCFIGYKAVREDWMDIHSGQFENKPGAIHEMPRNLVDDDARKDCSNGFHIGSQTYARGFGYGNSRMLLVKVNPADAVSVPYADAGKLRACRYEVLEEIDRDTLIEEPLYAPRQQEDSFLDDDPFESDEFDGDEGYDDDDIILDFRGDEC